MRRQQKINEKKYHNNKLDQYDNKKLINNRKINNFQEIDCQVAKILADITNSQFYKGRVKHIKIKLQSWIDILTQYQFNNSWRTNKINYLKLLNLMCQCQYLTSPFNNFPSPTSLPVLQKHQINHIIDQVQKQVKMIKLQSKTQNKKHSKPIYDKIISENENPQIDKKIYKTIKINEKCDLSHDIISTQKDVMQNSRTKIKNQNQMKKSPSKFHQNQDPLKSSFSYFQRMKLSKKEKQSVKFYRNSYHQKNTKYRSNSIINSINLSISPVTVSSQIRKQIHRSKSRSILNKSIDFLKSKYDKNILSSRSVNVQQFRLRINSSSITNIKKQYWQSNTFTGNATPKYLNNYHQGTTVVIGQQDQIPTFRSSDKQCNCLKSYFHPLNQVQI